MSNLLIPLIIVGVILLLFIIIYNTLISRRNQVDNAFGGMDAQLKQRYDLIPNLVATVQQYAKHETELLTNLTNIREKATGYTQLSNDEKIALDNKTSREFQGFMLKAENYPDLKASDNFVNLQRSLNETESQIAASRRAYNAAVTSYNTAIQSFPNNLLAGMMGLKTKEVFQIPETERQNVNINNLFNK